MREYAGFCPEMVFKKKEKRAGMYAVTGFAGYCHKVPKMANVLSWAPTKI